MNKSTLVVIIIGSTLASSCQSASEYPNIVLIFADDLGYGDVSCLNSKSKIQTPNIDGLAASGVTFTDAHSSSAVSTPSRYGLLTGRYAWKTSLKKAVLQPFDPPLIERERKTIGSMLKSKGYQTACIGKWHLGMNWETTDENPPDVIGSNIDYNAEISDTPTSRGFNYFYGISASLGMPPFLFIENSKIEIPDIEYSKTAILKHGIKNPYGRSGYGIKGRMPQVFMPAFTQKVKEKIKEYSKVDQPFFIYYGLNSPHKPVAPNKKFLGKSGAGDYGDFVVEIDSHVGGIVRELEVQGVLDNTIIILSSDNGPEVLAFKRYLKYGHNSSGDLKGVKRDLWEGGHRVPLFISWPNGLTPRIINRTVSLCDFYATLADIVSYDIPPAEAEDSYSLMPLLSEKGEYNRQATIYHSANGRFAIRKADWVLIEKGIGNDNNRKQLNREYYYSMDYDLKSETEGELYNLKNDLYQRNNLYAVHPEIVSDLLKSLDEIRQGY